MYYVTQTVNGPKQTAANYMIGSSLGALLFLAGAYNWSDAKDDWKEGDGRAAIAWMLLGASAGALMTFAVTYKN